MQVERKLDLTDTIKDGARLFLLDEGIRRQLILALTEDSKLHVREVCKPFLLHFLPFICGKRGVWFKMLHKKANYKKCLSVACGCI